MLKGAVVALMMAAAVGGVVRADIIDRIVAVVDNALITQSDVSAAVRLGLEHPPASAQDPFAAVLDKLIERRLTLVEVDRYAPPEPTPADIDLRLQQVRLSFSTSADFDVVLRETGLDEAQLRRYLRDELRIAGYLQQRFGASVQPSEEEILAYYRTHPDQFSRNGVLRPFDAAHDDARAVLMEENRRAAIKEWIANLRRRANVNVLYAPTAQRQGVGTTTRR